MNLTLNDFAHFFLELHGYPPYPWQVRLASLAIEGTWPAAIDLPTSSGKTACLDAAVFGLACQAARPLAARTAPRRIFFCVNRRVIVDEAHQRALAIARGLLDAERGKPHSRPVLHRVATALRNLAGSNPGDATPPLDVLELRGGLYRDNRWARSAAQPTVVCTTIDQLGSRLLFRGYGVSPQAAPIQAALVAYDSLILLDEAHISRPFLETLSQVRSYLDAERWAETGIGPRPLFIVPMTATLPPGVDPGAVLDLKADDRAAAGLNRRLGASKRARLEEVPDTVTALVEHAERAVREKPTAVGVIVNRVETARAIHWQLSQRWREGPIELVIGAMRPIDRDEQSTRLASRVGRERPNVTAESSVVVATQCLEVGADYDFDVLLTECASLDALRQRFGRLNRAGRLDSEHRPIEAWASIVINQRDSRPDEELNEDAPADPIYGNALARTWNWLTEHAEETLTDKHDSVPVTGGKRSRRSNPVAMVSRSIDLGIDAFQQLLAREGLTESELQQLLAPSAMANAPVILPAYIDHWCQTSPQPLPDPEVDLFLHGAARGTPDVLVCWRADLVVKDRMIPEMWCDVVSLLPPTSAECMCVPLARLRAWTLRDPKARTGQSDLLEEPVPSEEESEERKASCFPAVLWRGAERSRLVSLPDDLRDIHPGDTLVLPVHAGGWNELGHVPGLEPDPGRNDSAGNLSPSRVVDRAEEAFLASSDRRVLRLHPALLVSADQPEVIQELLARLIDDENRPTVEELRELLSATAAALPADASLRETLEAFANPKCPWLRDDYPDRCGVVLTFRQRLRTRDSWLLPALDEGEDELSRLFDRQESISLEEHTRHVRDRLARLLTLLPCTVPATVFDLAAELHDWGKADERFQALLLDSDRTEAWLAPDGPAALMAKSARLPRSPGERRAARRRAGLPDGYRHEMLSMQLAERSVLPPEVVPWSDSVLHLVAAHHGYARPFAPVVLDDHPPEVTCHGVVLSPEERLRHPPHRLDSGVAERFWTLTQRYGWWGLAYLETLFRLSDQQASADEDAGTVALKEPARIEEANS